jgi:hypothetical protein
MDLASWLVADGLVPQEAVSRALRLQRSSGGALDTALLELDLVDEESLALALARAAGLPPAPPAVLAAPHPQLRKVLPGRLAEQHRVAPFRLDGRELVVLAAWPVDLPALDELAGMRGIRIVAHAAPELWVAELQHRVYGTPVSARLAKLARTLAARAESALDVYIEGVDSSPEPAPAAAPRPTGSRVAAPRPARGPSVRVPPVAPAARLAGATLRVAGPAARSRAEAVAPRPEPSAAARPEPVPAAPPPAAAPVPAATPASVAPDAPDALEALAAAATREDVVRAALAVAAARFELAAFFAVARGRAFCVDAAGADPAAVARARAFVIPLPAPGVLGAAAGGVPHGGPIERGDPVAAALGRGPLPGAVLQPVRVAGRVAGILYGDQRSGPVDAARASGLTVLAGATGAALERIVRARKGVEPA